MLIFFSVFVILINLLFGVGQIGMDTRINNYAHIGGGLSGFAWGFAFFPRVRSQSGETMRKVGWVLVALFFLLQFILFYTVREPHY